MIVFLNKLYVDTASKLILIELSHQIVVEDAV